MSLSLTRKMNTGIVLSTPEGKLVARVVIRKCPRRAHQVRVYIDAEGLEISRIDENGELEAVKKD